jgi:hypothetical protein
VPGARDPHSLPIFDSGGHFDLTALQPGGPATAAALGAGRLWHSSRPPADIAGDIADHLAKWSPRHLAQMAISTTFATGGDRRSGLRAVAMAVLASADGLIGNLATHTGQDVGKRDLD